jgi:hypothetical protein
LERARELRRACAASGRVVAAVWDLSQSQGRQSLVLAGDGGSRGIQQSFATEPGRIYLFSGWISHTPGTTEGLADLIVNGQTFVGFSHSEKYFGTTTPTDMRWVRFVLPIRATGTTMTLTINGQTPGGGVVFHGLAVTPVDPQNP